MKNILILTILFFIGCTPPSNNDKTLAEEGSSPFSSFKFEDNKILVGLNGDEYTFLKMDSFDAQNMLALFKDNFDDRWQKRFSEDFVEYSNKIGIYPKAKEPFTLINDKGETITLVVSFTSGKRAEAKRFFEKTYVKEIDIKKRLSKQDALDDLKQLETLLLNNYSYFFLNNVDIEREIQTIREGLPDEISVYDFSLLINKLINKFGDGHSGVRNVSFKEKGILPFKTSNFKDQIVCYDEKGLVDKDFPYLHSINGIDVQQLLEVAEKQLTPDASSQFKKMVKSGRLNRIGHILEELGNHEKTLNIKLQDKNGLTSSIKKRIQKYEGFSPKAMFKMLEDEKNYSIFETKMMGDIGYVKIKSMRGLKDSSIFLTAMNSIKDSKKIIIDVRDNGGGKRDILMTMAPHFINSNQGYIIGNIAKLRTNETNKRKSLKDRYIYQIDDEHFSKKDSLRINDFLKTFNPSVALKDSLYSPNYFLYIEGKENALFSRVPTVVLMNEGCYSATDIFLSSFKEIDKVTLIGTKSGGGSGRLRRLMLDNSVIKVHLSSIVSYQPNGSLYDREGVAPDIVVEKKQLSDFLGTTDNQLEFAIDYLGDKD